MFSNFLKGKSITFTCITFLVCLEDYSNFFALILKIIYESSIRNINESLVILVSKFNGVLPLFVVTYN